MRQENGAPRRNTTTDAPDQPDAMYHDLPDTESVARTPQPKVLARIPRVGSDHQANRSDGRSRPARNGTDEPIQESGRSNERSGRARRSDDDLPRRERRSRVDATEREHLPGFDGRVINQRLATRILIGGVAVLLLIAIVPLAFNNSDSDDATADSETEQPAWQPENPAPAADAAPAWQPLADGQTPSPRPESEQSWQAEPGQYATENAGPSSPTEGRSTVQKIPQPPESNRWGQPRPDDQWATANRGQALPSEDLPDSYPSRGGEPVDSYTGQTPSGSYAHDAGRDRSYGDPRMNDRPAESSAANWDASAYGPSAGDARLAPSGPASYDASPLPGPHGPAGTYNGTYQAATPNPPYRQASRPERPSGTSRTAPTGYTAPADGSYSAPASAPEQHWSPDSYESAPYTPVSPPPAPNPQSRYDAPASNSYPAGGYGRDDYSAPTGINPNPYDAGHGRPSGGYHNADSGSYGGDTRPAAYQAPASSQYDRPYGSSTNTLDRPYGTEGASYDAARPHGPSATTNQPGPAGARFQGGIEQPPTDTGYSNTGTTLR